MTSSSLARSVTVRVIGPIWPVGDGYPAQTPDLVTRPGVGRMPTVLFHVLGRRIEANPSCPIATVPKFAVIPAAGPPDDPPTVRSRSYGLRVAPNSDPYVSPPPPSPSVILARMMAPACFTFATPPASRVGT